MTTSIFIQAVSYIGITVLGAWLFWCLYVFAMGIYRAKLNGRIYGFNKVLAFPVVVVAVVVDVGAQYIVAPVVFLDLPRKQEHLVTSRLQRYMAGPNNWRRRIAEYVCDHLLDPFDPNGDHC